MDVLVYDDRDRRYVPMVIALIALLLGMAIAGGLSYQLGQAPPSEALSGVTEPQAAAVPETACGSAVERADAALSLGARLDAALAQQSSVLDDLLEERATRAQVLAGDLPPLATTTGQRQAFLDAVRDYEQARADCRG